MPGDTDPVITITDPQQDRYSSLRLIDWWDQERVRKAHVMVVGAGALGNEVLKNLALLGVGYLFIADFDVVEASNLTRSVLFRPEDGGRPKSLVAAERVEALNSDVRVVAFSGDVTRELGTGVFRQMDVVIGCLDNRKARMAVNQACWNTKKPWVDGALSVLSGLIRVFIPPQGACYECTMTEKDYALMNIRYSCPPGFVLTTGREPTMPTTASIIAAMEVQEALKLLHGLPVQAGQVVYYSGETMQLRHMSYPQRQDCPAHNVYESIIELSASVKDLTVGQLKDLIQPYIQGEGILYLPHDIVTYFYCATCDVKEAVYLPYDLVVPEKVGCPRCETLRTFDVTSAFALNHLRQNISLVQLRIPALHILPVRSGKDWLYFELNDDKQHLLHNWLVR